MMHLSLTWIESKTGTAPSSTHPRTHARAAAKPHRGTRHARMAAQNFGSQKAEPTSMPLATLRSSRSTWKRRICIHSSWRSGYIFRSCRFAISTCSFQLLSSIRLVSVSNGIRLVSVSNQHLVYPGSLSRKCASMCCSHHGCSSLTAQPMVERNKGHLRALITVDASLPARDASCNPPAHTPSAQRKHCMQAAAAAALSRQRLFGMQTEMQPSASLVCIP